MNFNFIHNLVSIKSLVIPNRFTVKIFGFFFYIWPNNYIMWRSHEIYTIFHVYKLYGDFLLIYDGNYCAILCLFLTWHSKLYFKCYKILKWIFKKIQFMPFLHLVRCWGVGWVEKFSALHPCNFCSNKGINYAS